MPKNAPTCVLARIGVYVLDRGGVISGIDEQGVPRPQLFAHRRVIISFSSATLEP